MHRQFLPVLVLAAFAVDVSPARAQLALADVEIEGPIQSIKVHNPPVTEGARTVLGEMVVMNVLVKVPDTATVRTPTASVTLTQLSTGPMPGRPEQGFLGGTAIVTGESIGGVIYAADVFSDLFENVLVGEATNPVTTSTGVVRATVNNMELRRSFDPRLPAAPPINGFGFQIDPTSIVTGTLVAAEGYYSRGQKALYYHALEADSADLVRPTITEVSVLRSECRIRGGGRDELSARGGVHNRTTAATGPVQIQVPSTAPGGWTTVGTGNAVGDPATANPQQGEWRFDGRNLNFPNGCPAQIRARYAGQTRVAFAVFTPDAR